MISIVIPTYNEKDNLGALVARISKACSKGGIDAEIVIVDDNSPDGTGALAEELARTNNLKVIHRADKLGLSSAIIAGFSASSASILVMMDADLSHPPEKIPEMITKIINDEADIVIGSRYTLGGSVEKWSIYRRIVSKGAVLLARGLTKVKDPMSGFFALRRSVIEGIELNPIGFKIGLEILAKGRYARVIEVPVHYVEREAGKSKLDRSEYWNYLKQVAQLYEGRKPWLSRYVKYSTVGAVGTLVNTAVLWTANVLLLVYYLWAAVIAFAFASTSNYALNKLWTFKSRSPVASQYARFLLTSIDGLMLTLILLKSVIDGIMPAFGIRLDRSGLHLVLANLLVTFVVSLFNFGANSLWTFRADTSAR